ncbi:hypothetical protein ACJBU6_03024 [Exserohilum turcicum]
MRTHRLHVNIPLCLLHGRVVHERAERNANLHVHGHGHVVVCLYGVHQRHLLGPAQRPGRAEEGAARGPLWHGAKHASFRLLAEPANGSDCAGARGIAERVRNISVLQTTVAELITDERHQPRAYSIMPFVWCLGTIIGGALGGLLARPADVMPFFRHTLFDTYPFLLPNLVCTAFVVLGLTVGVLFLEETHEDRKYDQDRGREVGQWLLRKLWKRDAEQTFDDKHAALDEMTCMLNNHDHHTAHAYRSTDSSPTLCSTRTSISELPDFSLDKDLAPAPTFRQALSKQVCMNVVCYGILAFHTISLEQLLPILMSKKLPSAAAQHLPFRFEGGFGWSTQTTGAFLAAQGFLQMFAQVIVFPWLSKKLGSLRTFWITLTCYPIVYLLAPYLVILPESLRIPGLMLLLVAKVTFQSLSYPSLAIILANSSPSKKVLGTLNGIAMSSASVARGFGPTVSGAVDSLGTSLHMSGLAWWAIAAVALVGWLPGFALHEGNKRTHFSPQEDEEALLDTDSDADSIMTLTPDDAVETVLSK